MVPELAQSRQSFPISKIMLPGMLEGVHYVKDAMKYQRHEKT